MKFNFKNFLDLINPSLPLGGLEISDTALRYVSILGDEVRTFSVRVPPGILDDGQIKNKEALSEALQSLRREIGVSGGSLNVIATVATSRVYSQVFTLPMLQKSKIKESLELNLQMISPVDIKLAYYDSQFLGVSISGGSDYLGTFVDKSLIDDLVETLYSNNFIATAVEFPALSIARVVKELGVGYDFSKPYFIFNIYGDGVDFFILREGNLFFHYFASWLSIVSFSSDREISFATFENFLKREGGRVLNFYNNKWGGSIHDSISVSRNLPVEVRSIFEKNFSLSVSDLSLSKFNNLAAQWMPALGSAIRGLVPRYADELISLAPIGTEEVSAKSKLLNFIRLWRNIFLTSIAFLLALFAISDGILWGIENSASSALGSQVISADVKEASDLRVEALGFNKKLDFILSAKNNSDFWSSDLGDFKNVAGLRVYLERVEVKSQPNRGVVIYGKTDSEASVIEFKNAMIKYLEANYPNFKDINLPLTGIVQGASGEVTFKLSFSLGKK